jgi:hypothetical protein
LKWSTTMAFKSAAENLWRSSTAMAFKSAAVLLQHYLEIKWWRRRSSIPQNLHAPVWLFCLPVSVLREERNNRCSPPDFSPSPLCFRSSGSLNEMVECYTWLLLTLFH